ncbi:hypothetical protein V8G54_010675 [Vigna mungo]|uniref:Uncharacterized protein n=1 Tax=Vigna mungo TaxID=3915 RepID=A0AAQ3P0I2_VIGMU
MGDRNGDVRVYLIYALILACTAAGGVFLCMYLIYSDSRLVYLYLIAGMTLVTIPWCFWLLIYMYRCFIKPIHGQFGNANHGEVAPASENIALTNIVTKPGAESAPDEDDGERHVHFGEAVEIEKKS